MKPLLRVVLFVNALIALAFGLLFVLTPWASLYRALQVDSLLVEPAFAGQVLGVALIGLSWLAFHAAIDGALTARAARVSGHVEWLSGIVVLVWFLGLRTPHLDGPGQVAAAVVGAVLVVLGLGSVRLSSAVRRRERAAQAGAVSADRAEKRAAETRAEARADRRAEQRADPVAVTPATTPAATPPVAPPDMAIRPSARAPEATAIDPLTGRTVQTRDRLDGAVDPVTGATLDPVTGRPLDPVTGREIDPLTGKRIEPVIGGGIDPATGRRVDGPSGATR